ncbi:MAG TPA: FAD binding domain-containing protein [Thermoanaerobaculia bacterium]|jgi:carbon-monoxide dehydrogenase medium subunit|nr:FAD binding domain-containing protein [Thermoanaerobaculia bacterium]
MRDFAFHRPRSVAEAVALLRGKESARLLAGGQSLLPMMKLGLAEPEDLVSLALAQEDAGLRQIRAEAGSGGGAGWLTIGAMATHDEVSASAEVRRLIPGLAELAGGIGDAQVRNRGTLGGSLAHADPAADYPAAVLALGATIETDRRQLAADDFFIGLFSTALAADEIITAVRFPAPERCAYAKFPHRASKFAVVGVMVARFAPSRPQGAAAAGTVRVAVTGAGQKAFRLPALEAALAARFTPEAAGPRSLDGALDGALPAALRSDSEASAEYRAHLVTVMAKRAIQACL